MHSKWESIEDDIWAKIIVMERNRRVAKVSFDQIWNIIKILMIMMKVLSYFCYLMTLWKIGAERASPFDHFELSGKINPFLHNIFIFVGVVVVIVVILCTSAGTKNIIHYISICAHSFPFIFFYCRPTFAVLWSVCLAGGKASMGLELAWSVLCTLVSTLNYDRYSVFCNMVRTQ